MRLISIRTVWTRNQCEKYHTPIDETSNFNALSINPIVPSTRLKSASYLDAHQRSWRLNRLSSAAADMGLAYSGHSCRRSGSACFASTKRHSQPAHRCRSNPSKFGLRYTNCNCSLPFAISRARPLLRSSGTRSKSINTSAASGATRLVDCFRSWPTA